MSSYSKKSLLYARGCSTEPEIGNCFASNELFNSAYTKNDDLNDMYAYTIITCDTLVYINYDGDSHCYGI